jgi:hypothetical protein
MSIFKWFKKKNIKESSIQDIVGEPIDFTKYYPYNLPYTNVYNRELYPDRSTTIRSEQQLTVIRQFCRLLYETNPNATAIINGLTNYVISTGLKVKIKPRESANVTRLVKQAQKIVDDFMEENKVGELIYDCYERFLRDGEVFLRLFPQTDITQIRLIEPDHIIAPIGENGNGEWSYGIKTLLYDLNTILAYNYQPAPTYNEIVPAQFIHHLKNNVTRACKRGVSSFYAVMDELGGADALREAVQQGEKIRNSIAYVRQFAAATQSAIQMMNDNNATGQITTPTTNTQNINVQRIYPGNVIDIPKGLEYKNPPASTNSTVAKDIINASLNAVAARFQIPSWIVSGHVEDSSYASSLTAESPFIKTCLRQQNIICSYLKCILKDVLDIEISKGRLSGDIFDKIEIVVTAPSPVARLTKDQIDSQISLVNQKVMSHHTLGVLNNLDPEEEALIIDDEQEKFKNSENNLGEKTPNNGGKTLENEEKGLENE